MGIKIQIFKLNFQKKKKQENIKKTNIKYKIDKFWNNLSESLFSNNS